MIKARIYQQELEQEKDFPDLAKSLVGDRLVMEIADLSDEEAEEEVRLLEKEYPDLYEPLKVGYSERDKVTDAIAGRARKTPGFGHLVRYFFQRDQKYDRLGSLLGEVGNAE